MKLIDFGIVNDMDRGWVRGKSQPLWHNKVYHMWVDMWNRVTNIESRSYTNYKDCKIHEDFRYLSNYVNWIMNDPNFEAFCSTCNTVRWTVDKDMKHPGNRNYYPEYMTLTTLSENTKEKNNRKGNPKPKAPVIGIKVDSIILLKSMIDGDAKGFDYSNISKCIRKKYKSHKGYRWYKVNYRHNKKYRVNKIILAN